MKYIITVLTVSFLRKPICFKILGVERGKGGV